MTDEPQGNTGGILPPTLTEEPIPILSTSEPNKNIGTGTTTGQTVSSEGLEPQKIADAQTPQAPIAKDVVSIAFDTLIRRIMGAFTFGNVGSIGDLLGSVIIDSIGLHSVNQFPHAVAAIVSPVTTSSTSYVDISGCVVKFILKRATNILIPITVTGYENSTSGSGGNLIVGVTIDGVVQSRVLKVPGRLAPDGSTVYGVTASLVLLVQLTVGPHIVTLQYKSQTGTTVTVEQAAVTYVSLGK